MYFKQIELQGFKSFADHTQLNLEPGITAIVGPNGCGKSNILDALRWALGEKSARALRGSHMQDVIFNGSENRPAMGMSEVTLTFDNADSALPVDFAEVQVTRRLYRSGESEYLLNKAPCRLRDIEELFMDTGIGTNAYSLIGQGKIDMVLSSKPDDRRFLFEEAAGIIKYKSRKRKAMLKLGRAEQNLLRLGDIIAEVQRQMRSLKRQVNAAIRHREITAQLRELEIRNAWLHFNELSGQVADLKDRYTEASNEWEQAEAATSTLDARIEELNLQRIEIERMLMARRDGEHQVDSEMEKIENRIAMLRREIEFSKEQQEQARNEEEEFRTRAGNISIEEEETGQQNTDLEENLKQLEEQLRGHQEAWKKAEEQVRLADAALEKRRAESLDRINTRNRSQTELETLNVSLAGVDEQLEAIHNRQNEQQGRQEDLSAQLQDARAEEQKRQQQLEEAENRRETAEAEQNALTARLEELNSRWQQLREEKSSCEARLTSLRELRDSYEGFAAGVRAVMMAQQENTPEMRGVIGPVGDLLSTEKEYERAIEAALGGNINNVVADNADAAKSAIAFLKKHQAGRVTFLPLDTIRASTHDDMESVRNMPGVIGPAIDHIQCEARILPAVRYLLYNTVIVDTIDDAVRIARSERRFPRLVTRDGEVVSSAGAVTGGRTRHESRGLLGRSAEIEELEKRAAEVSEKIRITGADAHELIRKIETLKNEIRDLNQRTGEYRKAVSEASMHTARLSTELENLSQSGAQLTRQREILQAQREELAVKREEARVRVDDMDSGTEEMEQRIEASRREAAEKRERLTAIGDELADIRVRLAEVSQSIEETRRNRIRQERAREEALKEAVRRSELQEQIAAKVLAHENSIAECLERAKALSESREEAHEKVLQSQQEQDKLNRETESVSGKLKSLRTKTQNAQNLVHKLEIELRHKEDRIEFFQERILSEYHLALASLAEEEVGTDDYDENEREQKIRESRKQLERLGNVNPMAIEEYEALQERNDFLIAQESDLRTAREKLLSVVDRIDITIREMFMDTFNTVSENFKNYFRRLFNGGQARIYLLDEDDPLESGIEIEARPPGKKPQVISLLSGGEQAMTAIALLFSIFSARPSPFCVLDEVDAPLDDANIGRFLNMLDEFAEDNQFIIITHNKQTMGKSDALFGVTQQERGISQLVSVRMEEMKAVAN
jgi:chromosome segregation protein